MKSLLQENKRPRQQDLRDICGIRTGAAITIDTVDPTIPIVFGDAAIDKHDPVAIYLLTQQVARG